ncbi:MAG TPA: hypothetical protein VIZ18_11665 [Ktedonobacteraceae bacterium]
MTQQVSDPPDQYERRHSQPLSRPPSRLTRAGIISALALIMLLLVLFSGELIYSLVRTAQAAQPLATQTAPATQIAQTGTPGNHPGTATPDAQASASATSPITVLNHADAPPLQLSGSQYFVYETSDTLYLVSANGNSMQAIPTQGFTSNNAAPPILMPTGQLLYSSDGIWMTDVFGGMPTQIAPLDAGQVITSMALSSDGKMLAWSTEPANGSGMLVIHAGPLTSPTIVYQQSALNCPCFRIFSFMHGPSAQADHTLLLTDDRGSHQAVQNGLWSLDISANPATLQSILAGDPAQGPLALTPFGNTLLYSSDEGTVPAPTDNSVPADVAALSYANSLSITTLNGAPPTTGNSQIVLPEQDNLSNSAQYHWVTTPVFSPDTHTLAYVEFSSDQQEPYDRHSAIYTVQVSGSGAQLQASRPQLLATTTSQLVELGPWYNNHILTIYADGALYALDIQSGSLTMFAQPSSYARIVAVVGFAGT